jgi:2,5-dioxopentanoate dehydrogenase
VVVKGHPAHPKTAQLVAKAIHTAIQKCNMPSDTFIMIEGESFEWGKELVLHPHTTGVGFTGSLSGGRAIFDYGQQRQKPIPVFAEMGSTNPVLLLPGKLASSAESIAQTIAASVTMGVGQFCTNPGIILGIQGESLDQFIDALGKKMSEIGSFAMLHPGIKKNYVAGLEQVTTTSGVKTVYRSQDDEELKAPPTVCTVDSTTFNSNPNLHHEVFGPMTMVVKCKDFSDMVAAWSQLEGQLSTTLMCDDSDHSSIQMIMGHAEQIAGRIVFNGAPTGVDVNGATVHGGPYPASTDGRFTSVGAEAIDRWVRPICYQDTPDVLLPLELQNTNPRGILRKVNGEYTKNSLA